MMRARAMPILAAFIGGLALGSGAILGAAPVGSGPQEARVAFSATSEDASVVIGLGGMQGLSVRTASGKASLRDAPPRPLAAMKLASGGEPVTPPSELQVRAVQTAEGKSMLAPSGAVTAKDRPAIAIVIDDLGISAEATARAAALPREVTLSFLPYGVSTGALAEAASRRGHEIFLHLPMEPLGPADPGPYALRAGASAEAIGDLVDRHLMSLSAHAPVAGINNHMGSLATTDRTLMDALLARVRSEGLVFLDSLTTPHSVAASSARRTGASLLRRDIFLDHSLGYDAVLAQLTALEDRARSRGVAVAIAHPRDTTLDVLEVWVRGLDRKGIRLVSATEALSLQQQRPAGQMLAVIH